MGSVAWLTRVAGRAIRAALRGNILPVVFMLGPTVGAGGTTGLAQRKRNEQSESQEWLHTL
jgi:hypothetical protein